MFYYNQILPVLGKAKIGHLYNANAKEYLSLAVGVDCKLKAGRRSFSRPYTSFTKALPFYNVEFKAFEEMNDYGGFNSSLLDANGAYVPRALKKYLAGDRLLRKENMFELASMADYVYSSEASLFFNLIRQYYLLKAELPTYDQDEPYYDDGHVRVSLSTCFGTQGPVKLIPAPVSIPLSTDGGCVVGWDGMTSKEMGIIRAAMGPLTGTDGIGLAMSTPTLTGNLTVGNQRSQSMIFDYSAWNDAEEISKVIVQLVEDYRLYNAFETGLYLTMQISCHFEAPTAEAVKYRAARHYMTLPKFSTNRFNVSALMEGSNGATRPSAMATFKCWLETPHVYWMFSAIMNSAAEFKMIKSLST